jgi:PAS domain S-box-containing protein
MKVLLFFVVLSSLCFASTLQKVTLQLQWKHQFEFAGFYAAKEKGFYEEVGLDVEFKEFQEGMNLTQELLTNDKIDYATSYSSSVIDYFNNASIVLVANFFKQSPLVLAVQEDINSPKDLKGKKIMGLLDSTHNHTLMMMLNKYNLSSDDFINVSREFAVDKFIKKEVDAISVFTTNEIFTLNLFGAKYNILDPAAYGIKFYDVNLITTQKELKNNPQRVEAFRSASIKGWEYALNHKEEIADIILEKYNTQNKSKEALLFEANQIEQLMLTHVYPIGSIDEHMIRHIADNFVQSQLLDTNSIHNIEAFIYKPQSIFLELNEAHKSYLNNKKSIKMCVDPNWMPLEEIHEGVHVGIAADFMNLIEKKIQTPIELVPTNTWSQSLQKAKTRECDILSLAEKTPQRSEYMNFTTPYVQTPIVIATKSGVAFMDDLNKIKSKPLAIVKDYSIVETLKNRYPQINLIEVESVKEGLLQVDSEKVFGFLDNSIVINHEIQKNYLQDVSINGQFPEQMHLSIAIRNDDTALYEIMQKALLSVNKQKANEIFNKWNNITFQIQKDYKFVAQVIFIAVVLLSLFIYWNLKLKEEIKLKEQAKAKLKISEEKFRTLFDIAPVLLNSFDKNGKIVLWNKECQKVFGYSFDELKNIKNTIALFYPSKKDQEKVFESFERTNVYEKWHPQTKEGKIITTMWANVALPNDEIIHIGYDITQQVEDAKEIKEKTLQLTHAKQKLEALNQSLKQRVQDEVEKNSKSQLMLMEQYKLAQMGEMIENIAHQWRQPLAQINSSVLLIDSALNQQNIQNQEVETQLNDIEQVTSYMSRTIDDFKNFFHSDKTKQTFLLHRAVEQSLNILKGAFKNYDIHIRTKYDQSIEVKSHPEALQQVIITILNNAKDALIERKIVHPIVEIETLKTSTHTIIKIYDNALGIEHNIQDKVFEPYFTTKHKSQGTGLGLYMAKMITEQALEGELKFYNKNDGVCFEIVVAV